jgi:pSer/pThr/pTyr-binding forkhead associated (FHA) protein
MDALTTGTLAGIGSFHCRGCGYAVSLEAADTLPECPACEGQEFVRASLFADHIPSESYEEPELTNDWFGDARAAVTEPGAYLAYERDGKVTVYSLRKEWTRIGRSLAADIRFDDPTVSRRHALIVRQADGVRVLDDRSLNGVFVNGERVEWSALGDGDELVIGRHLMRFISLEAPSAQGHPADTALA